MNYTLSNAYPYITEFKKPTWYPFSLKKEISDFYIPYYDLLVKYYNEVINSILSYKNINLENLYWFLNLGRYLRLDLEALPILNDIYKFVQKCQVKVDVDILGFKFTPFSSNNYPDTWSTSFALVILKLIGKLNEYFLDPNISNKKQKIINFINSCKDKKSFLHCNHKCDLCSKTSEYKTLYSVLESFMILYDGKLPNDILLMIDKKNSTNKPKNVFRLIDLLFYNSYDELDRSELEDLINFQKRDGGFSFSKSNIGQIKETFWIGYLLENYSFLIDYPRGNLYSFIVRYLKQIDLTLEPKNPLKMMDYSKLIILLSYVWENLISELESLVFTRFSESKSLFIDLDELTVKGGIGDAEYETIAFINLKYNINLSIVDNDNRFNIFKSKLEPLEQYFAQKVYLSAKQYVRFSISDIVEDYNRRKGKNARIGPQIALKLTRRMLEEQFFNGKIIEKKRIFRKSLFYFNREQFINRIIKSDKLIDYEEIQKEKRRLEEVREDIFNMTREMKESAKNIMREVESLIFVGEIEYAEKRLKTNIKKALFDAEFFNKNIETLTENFEFIKAKDALKTSLNRWKSIYNGLQSNFQNVNLIMLQKIKESEKVIKQKDILNQLENTISANIADIGLSFDIFKEILRKKLDKRYTRENVQTLQSELESIIDKIREYDHQVIENSQKISSENDKIRKKRKRLVEEWVNQKEDFEQIYSYYYDGFKTYHNEIDNIDNFYNNYLRQVEELQNKINNFILDKQFDSAFEVIDEEFKEIFKNIDKESDKFLKSIGKTLRKKKKLYLLFVNLEKEWESQKKELEDKINKIRFDLRNKVEIDKNRQLREDFIKLVNDKIDFLDDAIFSLEDQMYKMLTERIPTKEVLEKQFDYLEKSHSEAIKAIEDKLKDFEKTYSEFRNQIEAYLNKWEAFQTSYEPRVNTLKENILEEIIKKALNTCTYRTNSNQIDIARVAEELHMNKKNVRKRVEVMLEHSKITGDLVKGTCFLILHNNEWRINKRLKLFLDGELNEIQAISSRMTQLFESSLINATFQKNVTELREISKKFFQKIDTAEQNIQYKINELRPNRSNQIFTNNMKEYRETIKKLAESVDSIVLKVETCIKLSQFMEKRLDSIRNVIHVRTYQIEEDMEKREVNSYSKNNEWISDELNKIAEQIEKIKTNFIIKAKETWSKIPDDTILNNDILKIFEDKYKEIYDNFNNEKESFKQKILNFEHKRVYDQLEKILAEKQNELNNYLGKIQFDVENRIEIKEFKAAMQKLHQKIQRIDKIIKKSEKELKSKSKKITSKSKLFPIKSRYLIDRWSKFIDEYWTIIKEKTIALESTILEQYIKMVINVFKDEYIPFNYLAKEFSLKKDIIKTRIIKLIGENKLPGKIYVELDIYYENEDAIDKIDKASVEFIKASDIQTYLVLNRIKRIAQQWLPIISAVASVLTILFYAARLATETYVPPWTIPIVIGFLFVAIGVAAFIKRGENKIKDVTEK